MNEKKKARKVFGFILFVGILIQTLFDPISQLGYWGGMIKVRIELPLARSRWEAQRPSHYSFEGSTGLGGVCVASARIDVRDEQVVQVYPKSLLALDPEEATVSTTPLPRSQWVNPYYPDSFFCDFANLTVTGLLDLVEHDMRFISRATFDHEYGFVSSVSWGNQGGHGLLNPRVFDCCTTFRVVNFQVLDN